MLPQDGGLTVRAGPHVLESIDDRGPPVPKKLVLQSGSGVPAVGSRTIAKSRLRINDHDRELVRLGIEQTLHPPSHGPIPR